MEGAELGTGLALGQGWEAWRWGATG